MENGVLQIDQGMQIGMVITGLSFQTRHFHTMGERRTKTHPKRIYHRAFAKTTY
jgi:hypothetical protein